MNFFLTWNWFFSCKCKMKNKYQLFKNDINVYITDAINPLFIQTKTVPNFTERLCIISCRPKAIHQAISLELAIYYSSSCLIQIDISLLNVLWIILFKYRISGNVRDDLIFAFFSRSFSNRKLLNTKLYFILFSMKKNPLFKS